jgi:hypothetical protein
MMRSSDISTLLTEALLGMGCDPGLIDELDAHNDIVLDFIDAPSIHVMRDGDRVRIWAALGERHDYRQVIERHAPQLLLALTQRQDYACDGNLTMPIGDETLQLAAMVHPDYLIDSEKFSEALNAFFERVVVFHKIVSA